MTSHTSTEFPTHGRENLDRHLIGPFADRYVTRLPLPEIQSLSCVADVFVSRQHRHPAARITPLTARITLSTDEQPPLSPESADTPANPVSTEPSTQLKSLLTDTGFPTSVPGCTVEYTAVSPRAGADTDTRVLTPVGRETHDIELTYWMHPLAPYVDHALDTDDHCQDYSISWQPDTDHLTDGFLNWHTVTGLTISAHPQPSLSDDTDWNTRLQTRLRRACTASTPHHTVVSLSEDSHGRLTLALTSRDRQHHSDSAVHNADATDIGQYLPDAGTTQSQSHADQASLSDWGQSETPHAGIQLTVTSPPYGAVINYDDVGNGNWADTHTQSQTSRWLAQQQQVFQRIYELTREGGFCATIISSVKQDTDQALSLLPQRFATMMADEIGWNLHHHLVWNKTTDGQGAGQFGTTAQHKMPTYYHPNKLTEQIYVWRRGDVVNRPDEASQFQLTPAMTTEMANNIWHIPPVPPQNWTHPCPFPEELAYRLILFYAPQNTVVCDPYAGAGTTIAIADRINRIGIGTEIQPKFVGEARQRLATAEYTRETVKTPVYRDTPTGQLSEQSPTQTLLSQTTENPSPRSNTD